MSTAPVMKIVPPYTPELLPEVQKQITEFVQGKKKNVRVLEMGSGWSTIWFGLMKPQPQILSLEHSMDWAQEVSKVFQYVTSRASPVLHMHHSMMPAMMYQLRNTYYDLIYIDGYDEQRIACTMAALPLLRENGLLVLDDTHWPLWKECLNYVRSFGMSEVKIDGIHKRKDGLNYHHYTTLFYRSHDDRL